MSDSKPMNCEECGATMIAERREQTTAGFQDEPIRIDWDFKCSANEDHPGVHWIEYLDR